MNDTIPPTDPPQNTNSWQAPAPILTGESAYNLSPESSEAAYVLAVAEAQKLMIWAVLCGFLALIPYVGLVTGIFSVIALYRLTKALRAPVPLFWALLSFMPLLGLIVLLTFNSKANKLMVQYGLKLGLMGASSADIERLRVTARGQNIAI